MKIGISAIHVRPQKSGSHQPYMVNLINALAGLNTTHQFTLFVNPTNQHLFEGARNKMELVVYPRIASNVLPRILFEQVRLPLDVWRRNIDVMHYPGTTASVFVRKSDVVTVHHDSVTQRTSMSGLHNFYYDVLLTFHRRAGVIIAPTKVYANQLVQYFGYKPEQMAAIHHGVNPDFRSSSATEIQETRQKFSVEENAILTVTNTRPHKNIANLLRAYDILLTHYGLDNQLVMVGYVNEAVLGELIREIASDQKKMRSRIKLIPFLPHEQLPPIYAAARLFVFYSLVETFGMPLVEALACGLPIIASDIPVHREILGEAGELISPEKPELLAAKMNGILTNKACQEKLRSRSLSHSRQFSWEETARQTLQAYERAFTSVETGRGRKT